MAPAIEGQPPATWQELEQRVAQILSECGYDVEVQKSVDLARGDVNVDVWADEHSSPPNIILVECKHWSTPVTKTIVHGFRTVVGDSGANIGLIVSSAGFQEGAIEAAKYSNVRLVTWTEFQELFVERWYQNYMAPQLYREADPLIEYTEPINSRVFRKADQLPEERREQFKILRERYLLLGLGLMPAFFSHPAGLWKKPVILPLPLRATTDTEALREFPDAVLDATALRPFLEALTEAYRVAIAEFDAVFGERA